MKQSDDKGLAAAVSYISRGFRVIPIPHRQKGPTIKGWQSLVIRAEDAPTHFKDAGNIGVILGHGDSADVDLDCLEAILAAPYLLPRTATFGHASKPASHYIYRSPGLAASEERAARKFCAPDGGGLLELRSGGGGFAAQTVFPPSVHPSGEEISWDAGADIATVAPDELVTACSRLAACSLLARLYPKEGGRHDASLVLGGFLAGCGIGAPFIKLMAEAVGCASSQPREKIRDMIRSAADGAGISKRAGIPKMVEVFGKEVTAKCAEWLSYAPGNGAAPREQDYPPDMPPPGGVALCDFRAYMPMHNYIFMPTGDPWPAVSVNSRIPPVPLLNKSGEPCLDEKGNPKTVPAAVWLDKNRPVEQITWAPGGPAIIEDNLISEGGWVPRRGVAVFNLYRPPEMLHGDSAKAGRWLDLVRSVYPDDYEHLLDRFAHRAQRPQEKLNHALVLGGEPGIRTDMRSAGRPAGSRGCKSLAMKE